MSGPEYKVGPKCCNPGCNRWAEHPHHIFARSDKRLGGPFDWVEIKGAAYQNKVGICPPCHNAISGEIGGYKAAIKILGGDYDWTWWWCEIDHDRIDGVPGEAMISKPIAPIEPQPMTPEAFATSRVPPSSESETCPTCGHVKQRVRPTVVGSGRARKSWTIKVPDDAENGAEILDTLVDDLAVLLGIEANQTGRYYIVLPCVYYAHQEKARFIESLKGVGG